MSASRIIINLVMTRLMMILLALIAAAEALDNGLVRTPPMGWMSWMYYTTDINEAIIKGVADELVAGGYREAGYTYVCIDDGWSTSRDAKTHELVADPKKFPSGMKSLADYVHSKGLKIGMYADVGSLTCGGYSGLDMDANLSSKQYVQDVATFAKWGVDALKVDGCYENPEVMNITYPALSDAINASGHAMWLSCSWPCYVGGCQGGPDKVAPAVWSSVLEKCNTARDMNDIYDNIDSLYSIIGAYTKPVAITAHNKINGPGYFADADMLTAGAGGLSTVEETMQMVMWALFNSPLVMSNDLPNIDAASKKLLLNTEIIAINQDVSHPNTFNVTDAKTYCKNLAHGVIALAGLHQTSLGPPTNITLSPAPSAKSSRLSNCLLPTHEAKKWKFRDVINGVDLPTGAEVNCLAAQPGACLITATPVK
jgi:alpha-N-acetylgalactosaminidase